MTKKFTIIYEDDKPIAVEVDGERIIDPPLIPNKAWGARARRLLGDKPSSAGTSVSPLAFIPWLFLSISLLMLVIALVAGILTAQTASRQVRAVGNVVAVIVEEDSQGNTFYYPVVTFKHPDGSVHTTQVYEGSWPQQHQIGDAVTVRFDPLRPEDAHLDAASGFIETWLVTLITAVLGTTFGAASVFAIWMLRGAPQSLSDVQKGQE